MAWREKLIERLIPAASPSGGWGYHPHGAPAAEPTSLAVSALAAQGVKSEPWQSGLEYLADQQRGDGAVAVCATASSPCWPTALAIVAWKTAASSKGQPYATHIARAADWLTTVKGRQIPSRPDVYGHDTGLQGWPWVEGTHSWVEPTAYSVLGLRAAGRSDHPRTREGVELLLDRAFAAGGWNYGNTKILGNTLRPFPATTGIALTALAGEKRQSSIAAGIEYLTAELPTIRAPFTLSWGLIGLSVWGARPSEAERWLSACATRASLYGENPMLDALLLLADGSNTSWGQHPEGDTDG